MSSVSQSTFLAYFTASLSVILCWMFGIVGLAFGMAGLLISIKNQIPRARNIAISGLFLSAGFSVYYLISWAKGAYIQ